MHPPRSRPAARWEWRRYSQPGLRDGPDDILTVNLLPQPVGFPEQCIIGRANGMLERISIDEGSINRQLASYDTSHQPVKSSTVSEDGTLLAVILHQAAPVLALYEIQGQGLNLEPLMIMHIHTGDKRSLAWTCRFLGRSRIAVGIGRSLMPIQIFDVGRGTLDMMRELCFASDVGPSVPPRENVIYAIEPRPHSSQSGGVPGHLFFSGDFHGDVKYV